MPSIEADSSIPRLVLGTMTFGGQTAADAATRQVQVFVDAGASELDTAYGYQGGESERMLGEIVRSYDRDQLYVATKVTPGAGDAERSLRPEEIDRQLGESLERMQLDYVDLLYLHSPDNETPIELTLEECARQHGADRFRQLGLSNYASWQAVNAWHICDRQGWPVPSVYQGMYNAVTRDVEAELLPALRHVGVSFYAYNPLAGGMLTGKHQEYGNKPDSGRFAIQRNYLARYWKPSYFSALERIRGEAERAGITMTAAALRWMRHHSMLDGTLGDAIIIGASTVEQLEANLQACADGPLDYAVEAAFDAAWGVARADCPPYFRG